MQETKLIKTVNNKNGQGIRFILDFIIPGNSNYFMTFQELLPCYDLRGAFEGLTQSRPQNKLVETYSNS